jgi:hypothetical protein
MQQISTHPTRLIAIAVLAAALLAAAITPAAGAAVPKTGTWRGDNVQQLAFNPGIPYKTRLVITAFEGRIQTVVGQVRMECPSSITVRDVRVLQSWRVGRGPKVNTRGSFAFRADGAYFHGVLSRSSILGGASATLAPDCKGIGRYNLQRRF